MLSLTMLGGLGLATDGRELGSIVTQRRPMAVLAILALAGDAALSRERLAGLLWPDSEPDRARRSLAQALYSLRRATGSDDLVVGTTDLRLNRDLIASDLAAFEESLAAGRLAEAVERYRGPFLDGFYLPGAVDFERWVEGERDRIARRYATALTTHARRAEAAGELAEASDARRRLVALDPLDSSATLALIETLARAGDVAGAVRAARIHETLLADQVELPLPAAIHTRVAALQAELRSTGAPRRLPAPTAETELATVATLTDAPAAEPWSLVAPRRRSGLGMAALAAVGLATVVGATVYARRTVEPTVPAVASTLRSNVLAVLPFATDSVPATLAYLGEGVADALARMLTGGVGPRAVDPSTVFAAAERLGSGRLDDRDRIRQIGRAVGAGEVLVGHVAGTPDRLTLSATRVNVESGERHTVATVSGSVDSLATLLDALAARVLAGRAVGGDRARIFAGVSLPVLRGYLEAEAAVRDDRIEEAVRLYERVLDRDSTFIAAALGLAEAADRYNGAEQHDRGLALAWAARDRLDERDRAFLSALAGPRYPEPSPAAEQLAAWERAVSLAPDRASAWSELGERLMYDGRVLGLRTADERAEAAFRRALELDPEYAPAWRQLVELAALRGDTMTLRRIATPARLREYGGDLTGYLSWRTATVRRDSVTLVQLREKLPSLGVSSLRAIAMAAQHTGLGRADGDRAIRYLAARAALSSEQLDVLLAQHSAAVNQGRPILALDVTERLQDAQPGTHAHLRLPVLDALYANGDTDAGEAAARTLARTVDARPERSPGGRARQLADMCVLAQWRVARLGTPADRATVARVREAIAALHSAPLPRTLVPVEVTPPACGELLEAMLAVAVRAPDARQLVERLDALTLTGPAIGDARTYANVVVARLYQRLGDPTRALAAIRQRTYLRGWPRYLAPSLWEEARLALVVGDSAGALAATRRMLGLRADAEPSIQREIDSARVLERRLEAVVTAAGGR